MASKKILIIHQNFPGQFKHLAPALVKHGYAVTAMTMQKGAKGGLWQGVTVLPYQSARSSTPNIHPWVTDTESKTIRGEACFLAALKMREGGYSPDLILAHPGWGESLFLKQVWPNANMAIYCEFYYPLEGGDVNFDPEFLSTDPGDTCRLMLKNANNMMHFAFADAGISPTQWQASTFPESFRDKITVIHDGIDTERVKPNAAATLSLNNQLQLTVNDEIITFVNRNLEPYRGYHVFMRALPALLKARPNARVIIVGGNDVSYGAKPPKGHSWRSIFQNEVWGQLNEQDRKRVHFVGTVRYEHFIPLLQLSTVHVYLTYPFVLSWSLIEAMSAGCAIVASDTQPLHEVIKHDETGRLVNFFDREGLVKEICELLDNPETRQRLGANARALAKQEYDLQNVCLPRQIEWVNELLTSDQQDRP